MSEARFSRPVRLAVLRRYAMLDVASDPALTGLVELAAALCDTPVAVINMIGRERTHVTAAVGTVLDGTPLDVSICRIAVESGASIMVIPDTRADPRTADNPYVAAPDGMRFYAGATLRSPEGATIGTICVVDVKPRSLSPTQIRGLEALAAQTMAVLELKRVQLRLAGAVENPREAFFLLDTEMRFVFANHVAAEFWGAPEAALLGRHPWRISGQTDAASSALRNALDGAVAEARSRIANQAVKLRAGKTAPPVTARVGPDRRWLEMDVDVSPDGVSVHGREVTGLQAERLHRELLEAAIQQTSDMVLVGEAAGGSGGAAPGIVFANRAFETRTGFQPEDYLGRSPMFLQGPDTGAAEIERVQNALRGGQPIRSELLCYGKRGEPLWMEMEVAPVRDIHGGVTHWIAVQRDISVRRAEQAKLAALIDVAADAIYDYDIVAGKMRFSEGVRTAFGHDWVGEFDIPSPWAGHVHPDDLPMVRRSLLEAIASGAERWKCDYRMRRGDGTWADIVDRCRILRDDSGRALRAVGAVLDVTRERVLEARLRHAQRMEAVGRLTGGIAHDFNNLLTVILGNAELLEDHLADDAVAAPMARGAREAAERGAGLVAQLLAFSRRQPLAPRPTDVVRVLQAMQDMLARSLGADIGIVLNAEAGAAVAMVDPGQLENAILNLALNARDAMPVGGTLTIAAAPERVETPGPGVEGAPTPGDYIAITVRDDGPGMDAAVQARAFEPFFTTKQPGKGSGLGLSMVHGFALQSGGTAAIESAPGQGTMVKLLLPSARMATSVAVETPARQKAACGGETILMVEDDPMVRAHVAAQLGSLGYRVLIARDGAEALNMLAEQSDVDLLFTDIVMPGGMSGRSLAELARSLRPDLPILFTTGFDAEGAGGQDDAGGFNPPAIRTLNKPYRRQALAVALRAAFADRAGASF